MAKKSIKSVKKKNTAVREAPGPVTENLKKMAAALMIIAAITFLGAVLLRIFVEPSGHPSSAKAPMTSKEKISGDSQSEKKTDLKPAEKRQKSGGKPDAPDDYESLQFEIYGDDSYQQEEPVTVKPHKTGDSLPLIAIIIDDIGHDRQIAEKFMDTGISMTFAILPYSTFHKSLAARASARGFEVMLHLPMEPREYPKIKPGGGAILSDMTPDALISVLNSSIDEVPGIKGVNNHMGSAITADSSRMYQIFSVLKKKNLYFIDSRTTAKTVCRPSARLFRVPFSERDIFLDHVQTESSIASQLKKLTEIADKRGYAVGIGHPHRETAAVLAESLPGLQKKFRFVRASEIVRIPE
jgi:polysaccharide deacetylase 2 family uncharacterized protein YibQ